MEIIPNEADEQRALFRICGAYRGQYPALDMLLHVPNEGKRSAATGARMRSEGLRRGYPDLVLDAACGEWHGLRIELKRRKRSSKTREQKEWIVKLNKYGYAAAFCYGWEDAWEFIHAYLSCDTDTVKRFIDRSLKEAAR